VYPADPQAGPNPGAGPETPGTEPASWADRHWSLALAVILALAFVARFLYLRQVAALPFFDQPVGDSAAHLGRAAEIARGEFLPARPFYYCSIFYPYFLAAALALFRGSLFWVCATQLLAGVALAGLLATFARRLYGSPAGLATGLLTALYGPFAFLEADVLGVVWGQLALVLAIMGCVAWAEGDETGRRPRLGVLGLAGLAFGLAGVERPNLLLVVPLAAAWCALRAGRQRALAPLLALAGGTALPLAAVLALNVAGTGQWVPLTTSFGINLSLGYHAGANGTFDEPWERTDSQFAARHTEPEEAMIARASVETRRALTAQQASAYWRGQALEFIRTQPAEAAAITLHKAALMLNGAEVPNHLDYTFIRERAPALWLMPVGFGGVLILAVVGFGAARERLRRRAGSWLLLLVTAGAFASVLPFTVADRYRAPMVPALLVAAGAGVAALARLARGPRERAGRRTLAVLTAALLAGLISMVPLVRSLRGRDEWMFAQAYQARGNLPAAIAAYEAAVREEGGNGELLNNLAMAYRAVGDRARAEATLRRAIAAAPGLSYPRKNLGMLLIVRGEMDSALVQLREAQRIEPDDAEAAGAIGALLAERGEGAAAAAAFARARALAPGDARLGALIEHYSAALK
jgi:4-amino-4-deoxy-L-arabinose transferase-like glycosyltransferase